jgi:hypothetical protein
MRYVTSWIIAGLLACGAATAAQQPQTGTPAKAGEQAAVISGGIGLDARDELAAKAREYNLKLVFALSSREYVSDVDVEITNSAGRTVASHRTQGPWMYAKLPPGDYTVRATFNASTLTKKVSVGQQGQKVVNFLWPTSVGATGAAESSATR